MDDRVERWGATTLARLLELTARPAAGPAGVRMVTGRQACRTAADPPGWAARLDGFRLCADGELPEGFASGWWFTAPVMTMPVYLGYLLARFRAAGGELGAGGEPGAAGPAGQLPGGQTFGSLDEAIASTTAGVIVNCSGMGARSLVPDAEMLPVRGQVVVTANPGITEFFIGLGDESAGLIYLFPHQDTVVVGGTEERGSWRLEPDPATAGRILRDAAAIEPRLRGAGIVAHRVGLRPVRPAVRLEAESLAGGRTLVHNYGHGGAGVTLSWGCAADAAGLALGALGAPVRPAPRD